MCRKPSRACSAGQFLHVFDQCGMLLCLQLEVPFVGLQFAPFLLEQAIAFFKILHHVRSRRLVRSRRIDTL